MSLIVAVSGATASGKSTFSGHLCKMLADLLPVLVNQDRYFRDFREYPDEEGVDVATSNHPRAVLWDELVTHLTALKAGKPVCLPVAGTRSRLRGDAQTELGPSPVVVTEGHLLFNEPRILALADLTVFVDANVHERVLRRLLRDTQSGKTTLEGATEWYRHDVLPNVATYSEAWAKLADVVIPFDTRNETGIRLIADWVEREVAAAG